MIVDLFSKRLKRESAPQVDVYRYDDIPHALRCQVLYLWENVFRSSADLLVGMYKNLDMVLRQEYGVLRLSQLPIGHHDQCVDFFLKTDKFEHALDVIELGFRYTRVLVSKYRFCDLKVVDNAIEALNARFLEHQVGYQFVSDQIIRIDSQFVHKEVVVPVLGLISSERFVGAENEFLKAHKAYREKEYKTCFVECLKSLESVLKVICAGRGWKFNSKATSSQLLETVFNNRLIPSYLQSEFAGLRATLESGVVTIRNRDGGHGQGTEVVEVPEYLASYAIHLTASSILLLVQADQCFQSEENSQG